jgi:hydroxymethylglutaryl-CoA reductase
LEDKKLYERIFDQIDTLTLRGVQAIQDNDLPTLGELMNICHGMLNALQVSTPELEKLVDIAREHGALGAKLTGGGGGGSIIAIADSASGAQEIVNAIRAAGFQALPLRLGADLNGA